MVEVETLSPPTPGSIQVGVSVLHCKKRLVIFPSPAGMSLTKFSLAGNNLNIPDQIE